MISCTASRASGPETEILTTEQKGPSSLNAPSTSSIRDIKLFASHTSPPREIVICERNREAVFTIRAHMLALPMRHLNMSSRFTFTEVLTGRCYWLTVGGHLGQPPHCVDLGSRNAQRSATPFWPSWLALRRPFMAPAPNNLEVVKLDRNGT